MEGETLTAKYMPLAVIKPSYRFLVEVLEPLHLVPIVHEIKIGAFKNKNLFTMTTVLEELKSMLAKQFEEIGTKIDRVELIECSLLPKEKEVER